MESKVDAARAARSTFLLFDVTTRHVCDNRIMNEETTNFHFAPRPSSSLNHLVPQGRIVPVSVFGGQRSDREGGLGQGR